MNEINTLEELRVYLNECINVDESKEESVEISFDSIQKINDMAVCIEALKRHGITAKNYKAKVIQYNKFCNDAFELYGLKLPSLYPFSNPTTLYSQIDLILIETGLDQMQRNQFYKDSGLRERIPKKSDVAKVAKLNEIASLFKVSYDEQLLSEDLEDSEETTYTHEADMSSELEEAIKKEKKQNSLRRLKYPFS